MTASAPNRPTGLTLAIVLLVFMGLWGLVTGGLSLSSALAGPQAAGDMVSRQMDLMQRLPGAAQTPELAAKMAEMGAGVAEEVSSVAARWHTIQLALAALGLLLGVGLLVGAVRAWGAHPRARRFLTRLLWIAIGFTATCSGPWLLASKWSPGSSQRVRSLHRISAGRARLASAVDWSVAQ